MNDTYIGSEEMIVSINRIICAINRLIEPIFMDELGITFSQFRILLGISRAKSVSQAMIATYLELTSATVSRHIENLKQKNLITRAIDQSNRRKNTLQTTAEGEKVLAAALQLLNKTTDNLLGDISQDERAKLVKNLDRIFVAMKNSLNEQVSLKAK